MQEEFFNLLLIRYGEIGLKSKKVRRKLENLLTNRIQQMLQRKQISYEKLKLFPTRGRLFLYTSDIAKASEELKNCFGIVSISPAFQVSSDRKEIRDAALKLADPNLKMNDTFAIKTRRVGNHSFTSQDISTEVGAFILENLAERKISVNLTNPMHTINIEIRDQNCFLFNQTLQGFAGLPYGSQGKLISLISGGIDSPVASWLIMKRGCDIFPLYCDNTPFTTSAAYERVTKVLRELFKYSPYKQITFFSAPHGHTLERIKEVVPPKLTCIFCKRTMYKVAERLAHRLNAKGIVTGENLGQVASQTLDNLYVLNQSVKIPIFRPLIGFEKNETMNLSRKLGLYSSSIMQVPSCSAVPQYPETHGTLEKILDIEKENEIDKLVDEEFQGIKEIKLTLIP
ncbi:MAG: tRNA 4-thiouridine(8) synthase ThiI [Candidatus Helarchaeota archaeon]|nr:tRNA 4-thiouridine(8) synthase ThiI [Candidatus Helarchaeota archaeon]